MSTNKDQAAAAASKLLSTLDAYVPKRPKSWIDTPDRFAAAWEQWTSGYGQDPADVLKIFEEEDVGDGMIVQGSIPFYSLCEHHLTPFFGIVHLGYIPSRAGMLLTGAHSVAQLARGNGGYRIVGISKLARLVEIFTRRLQVQERITAQIADAFMEHVKPIGFGCVIRARHLCMESRGIQKLGTTTVTSALRGLFMEDAQVREEFLSFVRTADAGVKAI